MTVGVVGLGMIGGSIGLALREPGRTILGFDISEHHSRVATDRQCVDRIAPLDEVARADIVVVAVPPKFAIEVLETISKLRGPDTVVTDCTSVKSEVVAWADAKKAGWFVGGHPMAGHEKSGPAYASAWMFRNARWILTPTRTTCAGTIKSVEAFVKLVGATSVRVDAIGHDRQIAILSHLPHAFAGVLVSLGEELSHPEVAGGSWRDLTRVGGVDPNLWTQILMGNREQVGRALDESLAMLEGLRDSLSVGDSDGVQAFFSRAQKAKQKQEK